MSENFEICTLLKIPFVTVKSKDEKWKKISSCVLVKPMADELENIKQFKVFPDDIFLCGFQRSGTTLLQEMIWLIVNNFDFVDAKKEILDAKFPVLETVQSNREIYGEKIEIDLNSLQRPRMLKTHLPVQFLPDDVWKIQPKMIFISRDPRDVAVSVYHFCKDLLHLDVTLEEILQSFLNDEVAFGPYREHTLDYLNIPDYENILYLTYESVTANIDEAIEKVAKFLDKEISKENLKLLKEHLKIENMKKNDSCNNKLFMEQMNKFTGKNQKLEGFIRKGKIGSYKEEMPEEFKEKFKVWMKEFEEMKSSFAK